MKEFLVILIIFAGLGFLGTFPYIAFHSIETPKTRWAFIWMCVSMLTLAMILLLAWTGAVR